MTKAEERALVAYPPRYAKCIIFPETTGADFNTLKREAYQEGYEQAEKDTLAIIESRISEIIGDAQPKPALRVELEELIKQIKDEKKDT